MKLTINKTITVKEEIDITFPMYFEVSDILESGYAYTNRYWFKNKNEYVEISKTDDRGYSVGYEVTTHKCNDDEIGRYISSDHITAAKFNELCEEALNALTDVMGDYARQGG